MKNYLVAYDILSDKRAFKVRKLVYGYALSGQKSALELLLSRQDLKEFLKQLKSLLSDEDRVNIIEVHEDAMLFGKVDVLSYDRGVVIV
jgi:CRISPR-associated endonuclease Cas2